MPEFIDSAEVARRLEIRRVHFLNIRERLEAAGFPCPVPHCRRPLKWRASAVTAWIANLGRDEPVVVSFNNTRPDPRLIELARRA